MNNVDTETELFDFVYDFYNDRHLVYTLKTYYEESKS